MKYQSWLKINQQHKHNLITKLTSTQYNNFIYQFFTNRDQTVQILFKKLYSLFEYNKLKSYSNHELIKLNKLVLNSKLSLDIVITIFNKFNTINVTERNINKLALYLKDIDKFKSLNVKWGPGNHKNVINNINEHFNKHLLSEEGKHWNKILSNIDCKSYEKYAIDSFHKMKNVIIHTDGVNVHLSGFHNNVFIIGRYHNDIFGISSCYYVETGEKSGRYKGLCMNL